MKLRAALERYAWRMWRGEGGLTGAVLRVLLLPLEGLWRGVTRVRNRRYAGRIPASVEGLAVVSVGNVAVGGTGKTPLSAWVARRLADAGHRPAILLRGYGSDEVELHRTWNPEVVVEAAGDRTSAARAARERGADVAVLDDGFQHRRLGRVVDIVLVAAEDAVPGAVFPRVPYREPLSGLRRADVVVVTRRTATRDEAEGRLQTLRDGPYLASGASTAGVRLASDAVVPLGRWPGGAGDDALRLDASEGAAALTAIARPEAFRDDVAALTGVPTHLFAFPDHHAFSAADVEDARQAAEGRPLFVTEKDAVKLKDLGADLPNTWVVVQRLEWDWGEEEVRARLDAALAGRGGEDA